MAHDAIARLEDERIRVHDRELVERILDDGPQVARGHLDRQGQPRADEVSVKEVLNQDFGALDGANDPICEALACVLPVGIPADELGRRAHDGERAA